jgi:hypothetical protein
MAIVGNRVSPRSQWRVGEKVEGAGLVGTSRRISEKGGLGGGSLLWGLSLGAGEG